MMKRINKLAIALPVPEHGDINGASIVQELLGGEFGEMSTLNNYMFQSFNFRGKKKFKPFYDLIASITAEEFGHVELVANTINLMSYGNTHPGAPDTAPLQIGKDKRYSYHFTTTAQTAVPGDSMGNPWNGSYVHGSGALVEDLLHNYTLEIGARLHKMRVYEMTTNPTARELCGYLLVRGGTHIIAYAKAIEVATGVEIGKMLPVPRPDNNAFDHAKKYIEQGLSNVLYTWGEKEYRDINQIWKGPNPETGEPLRVIDGTPEGAPIPDLEDKPEMFVPGIDQDDYEKILKRLKAGL
ncbi:manganese catalase [Alkalihalobacillus alcalophilus ATCC 27647 = CGMCC 1.3604]|uniref:Manganese catalase n=1 Tax=Alkalihalobacillus alcalophilus ATCC 27647 = CGMCC 1.3604 TaxID=1218173 RepID=A0A094XI21_ALKAL|nr:manganese catalase family protein [Alkalihalobacillus alcalophilus]KGA98430.1 manganese catalase [Alkalihalobacillus alcalophilus ATCC 27647 = CGMCC 1.3604]MED1563311.1 manganese catalase family protein [Alkalihalobacillus alcalophilus]THG88500.1 manganese catalase [Alkalihalobacillus alcalophilus ATCC 27647 = CGMCC 1.3604]